MSHLELVALVVRAYDAVIRFFVDVLQFEGNRWDLLGRES
jgi:catechol 2,3-dioxygenase-like lactoylglutathione lyase family enzyme